METGVEKGEEIRVGPSDLLARPSDSRAPSASARSSSTTAAFNAPPESPAITIAFI